MVHFLFLSCFSQNSQTSNTYFLGISLKNDRFRKLQSLLPQKLKSFADFTEILVSTISTMFVCCVPSFRTSLSILFLRNLPFSEFVFFWTHIFEGFNVRKFQNSKGFKVPKRIRPKLYRALQ